jgi:hypothetical protein
MRRWVGWAALFGVGLGSCGEDFQWRSTCDDLFRAFCDHQYACGRTYDHAQCEIDQKNILQCDERRTIAELETCIAILPNTECNILLPCECYLVLCDVNQPCTEPTEGGTCSEDGTTTAETQ